MSTKTEEKMAAEQQSKSRLVIVTVNIPFFPDAVKISSKEATGKEAGMPDKKGTSIKTGQEDQGDGL